MGCVKYFPSREKPSLDQKELASLIKRALAEDTGRGDITSKSVVPAGKKAKAEIIAREGFLLCGIDAAKKVFKAVDPSLEFKKMAKEGERVGNNKIIAEVKGKASSILAAERVALNLLSLLSGVATKTSRFVREIKPYRTKITDTRKTIPGLRFLQKYAVRIGGGYNHRIRLDEMALIKDNHLKVSEIYPFLKRIPARCKVEIEVQNLEEFRTALKYEPDVIMLDNMTLKEMKEAVRIRAGSPVQLEASGGINIGNIKKYASTGVDIISVGELTDSLESADISLEIV